MAYVYRFIDIYEDIIYVGYTSQTLEKRMQQHWEQGHLPNECYNNVSSIEFIEYSTNADAMIMETYFINKYKPRFNTLSKQLDNVTLPFKIEENWKLYKILKKAKDYTKIDLITIKVLEILCFILIIGIIFKHFIK